MNALLIVADSAVPTTADASIRSRLEGLGHTVTYISDETTENYSGKDLVVVSESCAPTTLGTKYKTATVPVLHMEHGAWDNYDLTTAEGGGGGTTANVTLLNAHPLDAGLSGTVQIVNTAAQVIRVLDADLPAAAVRVWRASTSASHIMAFAYESGATGANSYVMPARRVGLAWRSSFINDMTSTGWAIFDAAVVWLLPVMAGLGAMRFVAGTAYANLPYTAAFDLAEDVEWRFEMMAPDWSSGANAMILSNKAIGPGYQVFFDGASGNLYVESTAFHAFAVALPDGEWVQLRIRSDRVGPSTVSRITVEKRLAVSDLEDDTGWTLVEAWDAAYTDTWTNPGTPITLGGYASLINGFEGDVRRAIGWKSLNKTSRYFDFRADDIQFVDPGHTNHDEWTDQAGNGTWSMVGTHPTDWDWMSGDAAIDATATDSGSGADVVSSSLRAASTSNETSAGADATSLLVRIFRAGAEAGSGADAAGGGFSAAAAASQAGTGMDLGTGIYRAVPPATEIGAGVEVASGVYRAVPAAAETGAGVDVGAGGLLFVGSGVEAGSGADASTAQNVVQPFATEAGTGADALAAFLRAIVTATQAATGTDLALGPGRFAKAATDATSGADAALPQAITYRSYETAISPVGDPNVSLGYALAFLYGKSESGGERVDLGVELMQGATVIAARWKLDI